MNAKHTPAPWDYEDGLTITDKSGFHIALVNQYASSFGDETHKANARLIAAAPELLSACQRLLDAYNGTSIPEVDLAIEYAEQIIAKAKGETP
jgi:hypothetical protein